MEFVRRGTTKRNALNAIAITDRLEGSKIVLDALEKTKSDNDVAFLKPAAESAIAILYSIRAIREGEVDDDFAGLALDACGLVFILINECYKILQVSDQIPEEFMWSSDELAAYLRDDVYVFVQKKIKRGFLKKHLMQGADDEKVVTSRGTLRKWTTKLGIHTGSSIHDTVETIISEKVSKHDHDAQAIRYARDADKLRLPQKQDQRLTDSPSPTHSTPTESVLQPSTKFEKLLPEIKIIDSTDSEDKSGNAKLVESQAIGGGLEVTEKENDMRQRKKQMESQAKRAEREKWRRSEQEFSRLPYMPMQGDTSPGMRRSAEDLRPGPSGENSFFQHNQNQTSVYDEKRDLELAAELQAKLAREVEAEDEQKALAIGIALHRQWEAEREAANASQAGSGHSQSSVQNQRHLTLDPDSKRIAVDPESNEINLTNKAD